MAIPKKIRQQVFNKYGGRCAYCGCNLDEKFQVDHAISKQWWFLIDSTNPSEVNRIENLYPACAPCNHYKRSHCIEDCGTHIGFRTFMMKFHKRLAKLPKKTMVERTKKRKLYMQVIADKYGITPDKPFSGRFYFELLKTAPNAPVSDTTGVQSSNAAD